jgi:hypothetical protein
MSKTKIGKSRKSAFPISSGRILSFSHSRVGGYLTTYSYDPTTGSLTVLSLHTGDAPGGIAVAYAE